MTGNRKRDIEVFAEAIRLPTTERVAFLDRACAEDQALRQRMEALLKSADRVGDFLEEPPTAVISEERAKIAVGEKPGDRVGRYKLLQQIGEGGYGVVFVAEQEEPIRRRVALKVVKPGMDTKNVIARFEAERQALALMDHPNIAHVFDAGATESGRPYFVMELVRGIRITDYCQQKSLSTRGRLQLFIKVCEAVQHAHQKGIIHRDIKPSNILVATEADGTALPKVIDFGIAKATTNQPLTDKTVFTGFEMLIGTPAYMSPEQAVVTNVDVDTRTDIYSLGVLLYELLTGTTPFASRDLSKASVDEIRRVITSEEPVRPSTRLKTILAGEVTAPSQRRMNPSRLINDVRGELDWIVMKALEKDRARRYATAHGLALDVERYLDGETVTARPPSRIYKFQKIVLRNKLLFAGLGVIALLMAVSLIVVSTSLSKERRSRREAEAASLKSEQVKRFLEDMLQGVEPSAALGQDTTMLRGILDRTAERIGTAMANQPAIEAELRSLIGRLYFEIGNYERAENMDRAALTIYRNQSGPKTRETAAVLNDLGVVLGRQDKLKEAEPAHQEALAIRRALFGHESADVATSLNNLGTVFRQQRKFVEAEKLIREALAIRRRLFGEENLEVADSLHNLSLVLRDQRQGAEAETAAREVLAMRRRLLGDEHPLVASSLLDVASALGLTGKLAEAEALQEEAFTMQRKFLGDQHPDVSASLSSLGDLLMKQGNPKEARMISGAAIFMLRKMFGENSPEVLKSLRNVASTFESRGKLREAETTYREVLAGWRKREEGESQQGLYALESVARVLIAQKKSGEAEQLLDEALSPALIQQSSSVKLLTMRMKLKARRGQWQQAADDAARAFEHRSTDYGRYPILAALLIKTQNLPAYETLRTKLLKGWSDTNTFYVADQVAKACLFLPYSGTESNLVNRLADLPVTKGTKDEGAMPYFRMLKALSEYRQAHYSQAAEWCQTILDRPPIGVHAHACAVFAMSWWKLGKKEEARAILEEGESLAPREMPVNVAEDRDDAWLKWLYARIQLDEATALINAGSAAPTNSGAR